MLDQGRQPLGRSHCRVNSAGSLELSTGTSIMSIGGFSGGDNSPTLEQFQPYVAAGQVHYFIVGNGPGGGHQVAPAATRARAARSPSGCSSTSRATDVGGTEVYDLTAPN